MQQLLVSFASLLTALLSVTAPLILHLIGKYKSSMDTLDAKHKAAMKLAQIEFDDVYARRGLNIPTLKKTLSAMKLINAQHEKDKKLLTPELQILEIYIPLSLALLLVFTLFWIRESRQFMQWHDLLVVTAVLAFVWGLRQMYRVFRAIMRVKEEAASSENDTIVESE